MVCPNLTNKLQSYIFQEEGAVRYANAMRDEIKSLSVYGRDSPKLSKNSLMD